LNFRLYFDVNKFFWGQVCPVFSIPRFAKSNIYLREIYH